MTSNNGMPQWTAKAEIERPTVATDAVLEYLDALRESGVTNMLGAHPYVMAEFEYDEIDARQSVLYWMRTFGDRHNSEGQQCA